MRLHCELSPNSQPVPFDYPHFLTGTFHRWMGANELHDGLSLYSLGCKAAGQSAALCNSRAAPRGLFRRLIRRAAIKGWNVSPKLL